MAAHQAHPSLGFSRQEHWSGLPFPFPMHESEMWKGSRSVVSNSSRPHGLQPTRLLHLWDFPGKSTGVGCHRLLQIIYMSQCYSLKSSHPRLLPLSPKDCSIHLCLFCCLAFRVIVIIFLNKKIWLWHCLTQNLSRIPPCSSDQFRLLQWFMRS